MIQAQPFHEPLLRCPRTRLPLESADNQLRSADRRVAYPMTEGVPDFRFDPPANPEVEAAIDRMSAGAQRDGWRHAVKEHRPDLLNYIDNGNRTLFFDLLPLTPQTVALEIGPGLGQLLIPLSQRVGAAFGLELSPAQARFATLRAQQEGRDNVSIVAGGDDLLLPYADNAFDLVVLNQVLEWVRLPESAGGAKAGQQLLLKEIFRVLKPGGTFFMSTKNRYSLRYLTGGRDENAYNIRFGNALPRWLMDRLTRRRAGSGPMGLLHSHGAVRSLLRHAGFNQLRAYWAGPDPRYPQWYIPAESKSIRAARHRPGFKQSPYRSVNWLMSFVPASLLKYVTHGHTLLAHKPDEGECGQ